MTYFDEVPWQLAGFSEPTGSGEVGRKFHEHQPWPMPAEVWRAEGAKYPPIEVVREPRLFWRARAFQEDAQTGAGVIGADMLGHFTQLVDGSDEQIADFARQYGPLHLCQHGLPASHQKWRRRLPGTHQEEPCRSRSERRHSSGAPAIWSEPFEPWREWSGRARALLNIAARHQDGKLGAIEDCRALEGLGRVEHVERVVGGEYGEHRVVERERVVWWREEAGEHDPMWVERFEVMNHVEEWLGVGDARLGISVGSDGGYMGSTKADGLFGALGLQLLLVLTRADGFALCGGCSVPFAPSFEHRRYCERCGSDKKARGAARQRRRRARLREGSGE